MRCFLPRALALGWYLEGWEYLRLSLCAGMMVEEDNVTNTRETLDNSEELRTRGE